jgi:hypothetical protein
LCWRAGDNHGKSQDLTLDPEVAARLRAFFEPYNKRLYEVIGRDLGWGTGVSGGREG